MMESDVISRLVKRNSQTDANLKLKMEVSIVIKTASKNINAKTTTGMALLVKNRILMASIGRNIWSCKNCIKFLKLHSFSTKFPRDSNASKKSKRIVKKVNAKMPEQIEKVKKDQEKVSDHGRKFALFEPPEKAQSEGLSDVEERTFTIPYPLL